MKAEQQRLLAPHQIKRNPFRDLFLFGELWSGEKSRRVRPDDEANINRELARDLLSEEERKTFALAKV